MRGLAATALAASALVACATPPLAPGQPKDVRGYRIAEYEVLMDCFPMEAGDEVRWRFHSDVPVDFGIEFRDGAAIVQPVSRERVTADEGRFVALAAHRYCLQWGTGAQGAALDYALDLRRTSR